MMSIPEFEPAALSEVVDDLMESYSDHAYLTNLQGLSLPSRECVEDLMRRLESLLYPGLVECMNPSIVGLRFVVGNRVVEAFEMLREIVTTCLEYANSIDAPRFKLPDMSEGAAAVAHRITLDFFRALPGIRALLHEDLKAAYRGDPAAKSYAEIILSYPGVRALGIHRLAHELHEAGVPILPRMLSERMHSRTGIDIHPGATIGRGFFIDHGTGVVIGETSVIGNRVKLYQGVTLGALSIPDPDTQVLGKRHPTLEDDVTVYAGATILGGDTIIGARSIIGSSVWITRSVAPDTKVLFQPPELRFKSNV